jgi:adenylate cyclase
MAAQLDEHQLAALAHVRAEDIEHLVGLGILGAEPFSYGDVHRVRLVMACDRAGLSAERIGEAIRKGRLSLAYLDTQYSFVAAPTGETFTEACERLGVPTDVGEQAFDAAGLAAPAPHAPATEDDVAILASIALGLRFGLSEDAARNITRVYGESLRRITEMNVPLYHDYIEMPLLAAGIPEAQMREIALQSSPEIQPSVERTIIAMFNRHQERAITQHLIEHIEAELEEAGFGARRTVAPPAVCFLDLAGYTRLTEELGDQAAAAFASDLASMAQKLSALHGGKPVKWLGDGVMMYFDHPLDAVRTALQMVREGPALNLPSIHAGVSAGPVVYQDGDYYGRTVNLAARIAAHASPGEVLATDEVVRQSAGTEDIRFEPIGSAELKGFAQPVALLRAVAPR